MSLEPDKAYAEIFGIEASQKPTMKRVDSGDPSKSWLVIKLCVEDGRRRTARRECR